MYADVYGYAGYISASEGERDSVRKWEQEEKSPFIAILKILRALEVLIERVLLYTWRRDAYVEINFTRAAPTLSKYRVIIYFYEFFEVYSHRLPPLNVWRRLLAKWNKTYMYLGNKCTRISLVRRTLFRWLCSFFDFRRALSLILHEKARDPVHYIVWPLGHTRSISFEGHVISWVDTLWDFLNLGAFSYA